MKTKNLAVKTQQHKAVSIRDLWNRMNNGIPLNVPVRQVFDGDEKDDDIDSEYYDEFADPLELAQFKRDKAEQAYSDQKQAYENAVKTFNEKAKKAAEALAEIDKMKGGINNETSQNEKTQN